MISQEVGVRIAAARQALKQGQAEAASKISAEVLTTAPDNLDALEIRALAEIEQGHLAAAEESLRSALALAPDRRWPYADLTRLLLRLARPAEAEDVARSALIADSNNADAHAMLGSMLFEREMLVPAVVHFERAIALAGPHPQLLLGLGRVRMREGRLELARPLLEAAASAEPTALEPAVYLAKLEERSGRFEPAMRHLDRAERIASVSGTDVTLQRSVLLERMGRFEQALALLEAGVDLSGAALLQRGRLHDRLGDYHDAWNDWMVGKSLLAKSAGRSYPAEDVRRQANELASLFNCERVAELPRAERRRDVPQPIFILGFPRSGTTLVEQILASHSAIRAGGELPFGSELREFATSLVGSETFPSALDRIASDGHANWPELMRDFYLERAKTFGLTDPGAAYFTDKMPLNEMWLPLLSSAFPQSPLILIRRHPLDIIVSVMAHDMTHGSNCGYRLEDAARHLALVDRLLAQYREAGFELTHELRYESLVADQLGETGRLMAAIGLPVERSQLSFHERVAVSPTPSYAQVREPLNDRSIARWRNYASELESVRNLVAEAMERGDYR
jgi:Tfp pilus assembly protein PilF